MGASPSKLGTEKATEYASASAPVFPANVQELEDYAVSKIPGANALKMRMAGDKMNVIDGMTSIAEESAKQKYSPTTASKAPSGYLSQSARTGSTGIG
jgi:hypothetical protein